MKKIVMTLLLFTLLVGSALLLFIFDARSGSINSVEYDMPEDGIWYCEELNVRLVLDRDPNGITKPSSAIIDGKEILCECSGEFNTPYLFLCCLDHGISEYDVGAIIYWWELVEYSEKQMILEDHETKKVYYFDRIE